MKLYIKYMVSNRCKLKVVEGLRKLDLQYVEIELGMVDLVKKTTQEQWEALNIDLKKSGLELMDNKKSILIERIKNVITESVHNSTDTLKVNFSDYLSDALGYDYHYLANIFSEVKGITIERYIIANRIERVKELLLYDELTLTEIADQMDYSSVAHLSNQFKKVTGLTPSYFKQLQEHRKRIALEAL